MPRRIGATTARKSAFGRALTAVRIERKMTMGAMADLLGCSSRQYQQWEYGERGGTDVAPRIARKLGLPSWYFEAALFEDRAEWVYTKHEPRTMVKVGLAIWAASLSDAEWVAFRQEALRRAG